MLAPQGRDGFHSAFGFQLLHVGVLHGLFDKIIVCIGCSGRFGNLGSARRTLAGWHFSSIKEFFFYNAAAALTALLIAAHCWSCLAALLPTVPIVLVDLGLL